MDEFIDQLLREDRVTDIQLPRLQVNTEQNIWLTSLFRFWNHSEMMSNYWQLFTQWFEFMLVLTILCLILQKRHVLEENNELDSRVSLLEIDDFDLDDEDEEEEDEDDEDFEEKKRIAEMLDKAKQSSKDERRDR